MNNEYRDAQSTALKIMLIVVAHIAIVLWAIK